MHPVMPTGFGIYDLLCFGEGKSWMPTAVGMTGGGTGRVDHSDTWYKTGRGRRGSRGSSERHLMIRRRSPSLDCIVGDPLGAGLDSFNRQIVERAEDLWGNPVGRLQDLSHGAGRENGRLAKRQIADDSMATRPRAA